LRGLGFAFGEGIEPCADGVHRSITVFSRFVSVPFYTTETLRC